MGVNESEFIDIDQLRLGMYIELGVGWLSHPFPSGSFKISSVKQIQTIRELGLRRVRYFPGRSDPVAVDAAAVTGDRDGVLFSQGEPPSVPVPQRDASRGSAEDGRALRLALLQAQQRSLAVCEQKFQQASALLEKVFQLGSQCSSATGLQCRELVDGLLDQMLQPDAELTIRLLSQGTGNRHGAHAVNVTVISLLLGKAMGLTRTELTQLGLAAFVHDLGKSVLPERVHWPVEQFSGAEFKAYQEHVAQGVVLATQMAFDHGIQQIIAQHHELTDGSGFPARIKGEPLSLPSRILAVVNRYDNLCNPLRASEAMTPHEALSFIFVQQKHRYDGMVLGAFIRMLGVHPPGSLIQLQDERYAIVVAANAARPLKPRVIVHDPQVARCEALVVDLETTPEIGIRRGIKPTQLPSESADYLRPRQRVCYYFEQTAIEALAA